MQQSFKIGTRGSPLALYQARLTRSLLARAHGLPEEGDDSPFEITVITTTGDRIQDRALIEAGGKGLFTKEIEDALLSGEIHCAVHSMKDMPTALPSGLTMSAILEREDVRDAWISPVASSIAEMPQGGTVGTASLRRGAQVQRQRPDIKIEVFRGNVDTRLKKLAEGQVDATLLAAAGMKRLGRLDEATALLSLGEMLPAPAQGAIGIETATDNEAAGTFVAPLNHQLTEQAITAERAFLRVLDGSCRTPIAALAEETEPGIFTLVGKVLSPDGKIHYEVRRSGSSAAPEDLGRAAGKEIREMAGEAFFEALARQVG